MSTVTLELSEHELYFLPPGTPAVGEATRVEVEIDGVTRVFLGRSEIYPSATGERAIVFLFYQEDVVNSIIYGGQSWILRTPRAKTEQEIAELVKLLVLSKRANRNRYWRSPDADFGVIFSSTGEASLQVSDTTIYTSEKISL